MEQNTNNSDQNRKQLSQTSDTEQQQEAGAMTNQPDEAENAENKKETTKIDDTNQSSSSQDSASGTSSTNNFKPPTSNDTKPPRHYTFTTEPINLNLRMKGLNVGPPQSFSMFKWLYPHIENQLRIAQRLSKAAATEQTPEIPDVSGQSTAAPLTPRTFEVQQRPRHTVKPCKISLDNKNRPASCGRHLETSSSVQHPRTPRPVADKPTRRIVSVGGKILELEGCPEVDEPEEEVVASSSTTSSQHVEQNQPLTEDHDSMNSNPEDEVNFKSEPKTEESD